ncbi:MAG: M20/M25/M40 family metallo-hydrolase, partial [Thiotrichales bacterium]|nr:M20/M25/M40 family metallo-hydrolase [Thiotrichales bacterium]
MSEVLTLAMDLIRCASVTPEDAGCQAMIADRLRTAGFECKNLQYDDVSNLWASHGTGEPLLTLLGHTDVVPTGPLDDWQSDPFQPEIRNDLLYGRGAADMKGSVAAMTT